MSSAEEDQDSEEIREIKKREEELRRRMQEAGCDIVQENGQRKYGGPPPNWEGPPPPKGSEIFIGKLPRDATLEEIHNLFMPIGKIYEVRLMMDFSGHNRGFAFVEFSSRAEAARAIELRNNYELRPNHRIGVVKSVDNCRLFIGGLPKDKSQDEIRAEMERLTEGVEDVIVYSSIADKKKNRGFAFVEYVNHRAASKARRKLIPDRLSLWGKEIAVDWAAPEPEIEDEIMNKVTVLYVRNLSLTTTEGLLLDFFNQVTPGHIQKVKQMRDFAFIHFDSREMAEKALQTLNNVEFNGTRIEVTWAKPARERSKSAVVVPSMGKTNSRPPSRKTSEVSLPASPRFNSKSLVGSPPNSGCFLNHRGLGIDRSGPLSPSISFQQQFFHPQTAVSPYSAGVFSFPPPSPHSSSFHGQNGSSTGVVPTPSLGAFPPHFPFSVPRPQLDQNGNGYCPTIEPPRRVRKVPDIVGPQQLMINNFGPPLHTGHSQHWMAPSGEHNMQSKLLDVFHSERNSSDPMQGLSAQLSRLNCNSGGRGITGGGLTNGNLTGFNSTYPLLPAFVHRTTMP